MKTPHIAFVGAGNMACSIVGGLIESGHPADCISAADPFAASLERLRDMAPVATYRDNTAAVAPADIVILAVKPQIMAQAAADIADVIRSNGAVVVSIAAGITVNSLQSRLGESAAIVRCMPNTPALVRCGATGLFANDNTSQQQQALAQSVMSAVGITCWVHSEQELDAITALSGSGPAYFFLFIEAMVEAGVQLGLDKDTAAELAVQTSLGAARMAQENTVDLAELRRRVTSPGGTTERAVQSFEHDNLRGSVAAAMRAAADRAAEMARDMG